MTHNILDIHTHRQDTDAESKAIINRSALTNQPLLANCYYSVGIHPWQLTECNLEQQSESLIEQLPNKQIVAIGEAGLDKMATAPAVLQNTALVLQVQLSEKHGLPMIIHCVKAMEHLLLTRKTHNAKQPWIWHGFRGKPQQAQQLLDQGFYLSFGEHYHDETMKIVPGSRLFLETDNSTLDIENALHRAAKVRKVEVETLRNTIHRNIQDVFF